MAQREAPQNPLHDRYASAEMTGLFSARHRYRTWRRLWVALASAEIPTASGCGIRSSDFRFFSQPRGTWWRRPVAGSLGRGGRP